MYRVGRYDGMEPKEGQIEIRWNGKTENPSKKRKEK